MLRLMNERAVVCSFQPQVIGKRRHRPPPAQHALARDAHCALFTGISAYGRLVLRCMNERAAGPHSAVHFLRGGGARISGASSCLGHLNSRANRSSRERSATCARNSFPARANGDPTETRNTADNARRIPARLRQQFVSVGVRAVWAIVTFRMRRPCTLPPRSAVYADSIRYALPIKHPGTKGARARTAGLIVTDDAAGRPRSLL